MAETKLTHTKVPNMKPKPKKKLGIMSGTKRQNITFRLKCDTHESFNKLLKMAKKNISYKIVRTDLLESLVLWATKQPVDTLKQILTNVEGEENNL